jgi:hypothetical protein
LSGCRSPQCEVGGNRKISNVSLVITPSASSPAASSFWLSGVSRKPRFLGRPHPSRKQPIRSDFIAGWGGLTAARVRDIRLMLSWRPMSAANKHRAKLPENPANVALLGQNDLLINGSAASDTATVSQGWPAAWRSMSIAFFRAPSPSTCRWKSLCRANWPSISRPPKRWE